MKRGKDEKRERGKEGKRERLALVLMLTFGFNCVCVNGAHAMWKGISRFWEDVKRETTKAAHNTEREIGRGWEDTKRETTRFAHDVDREGGRAWEDTKRESTVFAHSDAGKFVIKAAVGGAVSLAGYPAASGVAQELVGQIK